MSGLETDRASQHIFKAKENLQFSIRDMSLHVYDEFLGTGVQLCEVGKDGQNKLELGHNLPVYVCACAGVCLEASN